MSAGNPVHAAPLAVLCADLTLVTSVWLHPQVLVQWYSSVGKDLAGWHSVMIGISLASEQSLS